MIDNNGKKIKLKRSKPAVEILGTVSMHDLFSTVKNWQSTVELEFGKDAHLDFQNTKIETFKTSLLSNNANSNILSNNFQLIRSLKSGSFLDISKYITIESKYDGLLLKITDCALQLWDLSQDIERDRNNLGYFLSPIKTETKVGKVGRYLNEIYSTGDFLIKFDFEIRIDNCYIGKIINARPFSKTFFTKTVVFSRSESKHVEFENIIFENQLFLYLCYINDLEFNRCTILSWDSKFTLCSFEKITVNEIICKSIFTIEHNAVKGLGMFHFIKSTKIEFINSYFGYDTLFYIQAGYAEFRNTYFSNKTNFVITGNEDTNIQFWNPNELEKFFSEDMETKLGKFFDNSLASFLIETINEFNNFTLNFNNTNFSKANFKISLLERMANTHFLNLKKEA